MTRLENALDAELRPRCREIMKRKTPFFTFAVGVLLEQKTIDTLAFAKIALVTLAFVIVGNLFVELKERWKERF